MYMVVVSPQTIIICPNAYFIQYITQFSKTINIVPGLKEARQ